MNTYVENIRDHMIQTYPMLTTPNMDTPKGFGATYSPKTYLVSCLQSNHKVGNTTLKTHLFLCFQIIHAPIITRELKIISRRGGLVLQGICRRG
jgi:hypothetical protein